MPKLRWRFKIKSFRRQKSTRAMSNGWRRWSLVWLQAPKISRRWWRKHISFLPCFLNVLQFGWICRRWWRCPKDIRVVLTINESFKIVLTIVFNGQSLMTIIVKVQNPSCLPLSQSWVLLSHWTSRFSQEELRPKFEAVAGAKKRFLTGKVDEEWFLMAGIHEFGWFN